MLGGAQHPRRPRPVRWERKKTWPQMSGETPKQRPTLAPGGVKSTQPQLALSPDALLRRHGCAAHGGQG